MALYTLAPQPWLIFLDDAGLTVPNGQLAIYAAGTSTPATVYTSAAGTAHPFPITLDGAGRVPGGLYLEPGRSYKFVLHAPQIEDPLDGAILKTQDNIAATPRAATSILTLSTPGDFAAIDVSGVDIIQYNGVGEITIRGLTGGVLGQTVLIHNLTTSTIWLSHTDPAAPVGATLFNFVGVGLTPCAGGRGSASFTYGSNAVWGMITHSQGNPLTPPFSAADYTATPAGTWVLDAGDPEESFFLTGRTLLYTFRLNSTTVTGAPIALRRTLPYGWVTTNLSATANILTSIDGAATFQAGTVFLQSIAHVAMYRLPYQTAWPASTNGITLQGQLSLTLN